MKIQVLGPGCKRCNQLYDNVVEAVKSLNLADRAEIVKVGDLDVFAKYGVFTTPGLVIDEQVISVGKLLTVQEIEKEIKARI